MTSTAFDGQFAVCTPEEEEFFRAIEARQRESNEDEAKAGERAKGWYWVEPEEYTLVGLAPAYWNGQEWFARTPWGERFDVLREHGRILAPDEMQEWMLVPKEIHNDMLCAVGNHYGTEHEKAFEDGWDDALLAAPKPEDV